MYIYNAPTVWLNTNLKKIAYYYTLAARTQKHYINKIQGVIFSSFFMYNYKLH